MNKKTTDKEPVFGTLLDLLKIRQTDPAIIPDNAQFCFMLHDVRAGEIQKVEVSDLSEWLRDGSFESTDRLYISFLVKEF
jgi:hypothetical protein